LRHKWWRNEQIAQRHNACHCPRIGFSENLPATAFMYNHIAQAGERFEVFGVGSYRLIACAQRIHMLGKGCPPWQSTVISEMLFDGYKCFKELL